MKNNKLYLVVAYTRKYECRWEIIEEDGTVLRRYKDRKEAQAAFKEMSDEIKS